MTRKWCFLALFTKCSLQAATFLLVARAVAEGAFSTFVSDDSNSNLTFSINIPNDPGRPNDFRFYFSAPHEKSWVAFGFGKGMSDAFMLLAYSSKSGKNLTLSPRVGTGHVEPSFYGNKTMSIELMNTTGIKDGRYVVDGMCHDCRFWNTGSINFNSTKEPMIFAVGPELRINSDAKDVGLRRHDFYGGFDINLQAAWGDPSLFAPSDWSDAKVTDHWEHDDHEYTSSIHAILMIGTFVVLFPLGIFYKRIQGNVRWHYSTQALGIVIIIAGAGLGLSLSKTYNRSKNYNSPHQLVGIVVVVLVLLQATLGSVHHRVFKAKQQPTIMGTIHRFLGSVVVGVGIINGALGFYLAQASRHVVGYAIVVVIVAVIWFGASFWHLRRRRRHEAYNSMAAQNFREDYHQHAAGNNIPLQPSYGPPPAYGRPMGA